MSARGKSTCNLGNGSSTSPCVCVCVRVYARTCVCECGLTDISACEQDLQALLFSHVHI